MAEAERPTPTKSCAWEAWPCKTRSPCSHESHLVFTCLVCSFRACNLLGGTRSNSVATSLEVHCIPYIWQNATGQAPSHQREVKKGTLELRRNFSRHGPALQSVGADELTLRIFFVFVCFAFVDGKKFIDINREPECPNAISM